MKLLVPIIAILIGIVFALAVANSGNNAPPIPEDDAVAPAAAEAGDSAADAAPAASDQGDQAGTAVASTDHAVETTTDAAPPTAPQATPFTGLRAVPTDDPLAPALGGDQPDSEFKLRVEFTSYGAGLKKITLADYAQFVDPPAEGEDRPPYTLIDVNHGLAEGASPAFYPYAAQTVTINGQTVNLWNMQWTLDPGNHPEPYDGETDAALITYNPNITYADDSQAVTYRLPIIDENGQPVAEIVRTWTVTAGSYDLSLDQRVVNKTDTPLDVTFKQYGQGDVLTDLGAYLGDRRMFITGHFRDENPPKYSIYVDDSFVARSTLLKQKRTLWPNTELPVKKNPRLAWIASENRYFALITHAPVPADTTATAGVPELDGVFPNVSYAVLDQQVALAQADNKRVAVQFATNALTLAPGRSASLDVDVYAGPRKKAVLAEAPYDVLHFDKLIRYELGCTWCTFQWLAKGLLGYLKFLNGIFSDWGIAIIILVLTVRLILHPITKRAQTNMMKMSKQMQAVQPEMAKLKEKYKDDPTSLNRETMKLYKEKGINPANMLGCLPMLLQTPIWIALYAMLYFAIELRHEPAFYGVFQSISGGNWHFLEDLSVSDNFLRFIPPEQPAWKLTWLPFIEPEFRSLNILPLLMAVVFFFQMKLTTPPPQNDQQRQQQMIMKFMPFMFPVFLYSAPSGLTLYICASTLAGIVDSYIVRKHVREQEEAGTLFDKKPVKPGGFRDRMSKRFEMAAKMAAEKQAEAEKRKKAGGSGGNKNYKKRK
ncbi:MAG: YidC/Oxa1 family insertase periplasmic-domain containing protein [Planctomycetota bacterium]